MEVIRCSRRVGGEGMLRKRGGGRMRPWKRAGTDAIRSRSGNGCMVSYRVGPSSNYIAARSEAGMARSLIHLWIG